MGITFLFVMLCPPSHMGGRAGRAGKKRRGKGLGWSVTYPNLCFIRIGEKGRSEESCENVR